MGTGYLGLRHSVSGSDLVLEIHRFHVTLDPVHAEFTQSLGGEPGCLLVVVFRLIENGSIIRVDPLVFETE
jgi:hypothetical protein